jgi:hypothetical protein
MLTFLFAMASIRTPGLDLLCIEGGSILMTRRRRMIIAFCVVVLEVFAIALVTFGFFTRISGAGNPIGSVYMYIGIILTIGGSVVMLITFTLKEPNS